MRVPKAREIPTVIRSTALAALVPVMVRALPLPQVMAMLGSKRKARASSSDVNEIGRIAAGVVKRAPRFGVGECLVRSLVLYNLLRRAAHDPILFIGGRLHHGKLDCHSWIEVNGKLLRERVDPRKTFKVFYRLQS